MKKSLKNSLYKVLHEEYLKNKNDLDTTSDIFNLIKIIENYEEFTPDIKDMLNAKASRDKFKNCSRLDDKEK